MGRIERELRVGESDGVRNTDLGMAEFVTDKVKITFTTKSVCAESVNVLGR